MSSSGKAQSKSAKNSLVHDAAADLALKKEWAAGKAAITLTL